MKANLEFNLPDDEYKFNCAVNGDKYLVALECIRSEVRTIYKYSELSETEFELVERIYSMINDYMPRTNQLFGNSE
jgi:hypothetical protein